MAERRHTTGLAALVMVLAACGGGSSNNTREAATDDRPMSLTTPAVVAAAPTSDATAVKAALRYVATTDELMGYSTVGRREILGRLVTPESLVEQVQALDEAVSGLAEKLGVPSERLTWIEAPLASTTITSESTRATVDVWTVSIIAVRDASPEQVWRTVTVDLELRHGAWLVSSSTATAGPTPAPNELAMQSSWGEFEAIAGWTPVVEGQAL